LHLGDAMTLLLHYRLASSGDLSSLSHSSCCCRLATSGAWETEWIALLVFFCYMLRDVQCIELTDIATRFSPFPINISIDQTHSPTPNARGGADSGSSTSSQSEPDMPVSNATTGSSPSRQRCCRWSLTWPTERTRPPPKPSFSLAVRCSDFPSFKLLSVEPSIPEGPCGCFASSRRHHRVRPFIRGSIDFPRQLRPDARLFKRGTRLASLAA
jgi:hypothetical protein